MDFAPSRWQRSNGGGCQTTTDLIDSASAMHSIIALDNPDKCAKARSVLPSPTSSLGGIVCARHDSSKLKRIGYRLHGQAVSSGKSELHPTNKIVADA